MSDTRADDTTLRFVVDPDCLDGGCYCDPTDRAAVIREVMRLVVATPTDILVSYIPVMSDLADLPR